MMENYEQLRKELLAELKKRGIKSPAKFAPIIRYDEYRQAEQIDGLRQNVIDIDLENEERRRWQEEMADR
jgi:hypothetical protein